MRRATRLSLCSATELSHRLATQGHLAGIGIWGLIVAPGLRMDPSCWDLNMCGSHLGCTAQGPHAQGPALSNSLDVLRQVSSHLPLTSAPKDEVHNRVFASLVPCSHMHTHVQVYTHPHQYGTPCRRVPCRRKAGKTVRQQARSRAPNKGGELAASRIGAG